jgi:5-deoxy-glucuronate isomerase
LSQATLAKYGARIARGEICPYIRWDGRPGIVLDCASDDVPLDWLSFGAWRLGSESVALDTGDSEHVLVLVAGTLRVQVGGETFEGERAGGPFPERPGTSQACCMYVPRGMRYSFGGDGEAVLFTAPAADDMPLRFIGPGEVQPESRGAAVWRRDVVTLVNPGETSTNLVVGETYSPPGLWSGTPPHRHDRADPGGGESDHEEVYYFRIRRYVPDGAPGGVQLLYGAEGLNQSYSVGDRSVMALPGACHPVVAGPASELLYIWGLGGSEPQPLRVADVPASAFLKDVEAAFRRLAAPRQRIAAAAFEEAAGEAGLEEHGRRTLALLLKEYGFDIEDQ